MNDINEITYLAICFIGSTILFWAYMLHIGIHNFMYKYIPILGLIIIPVLVVVKLIIGNK
jgi:hypothetical protein